MALGIADTAYVLDLGRVSLSGPAERLAADDAVRKLYLGHGGQVLPPADAGARRPHAALSRWQG
jgi:branched-chain amino acid transport system ATP-binding protein